MKRVLILFIFLTALGYSACKKILEIDEPKNKLVNDKVFADDQSALAVLSNIYAQFNAGLSINGNLTASNSLYTDDLATTSTNDIDQQFFSGSLQTNNATVLNLWRGLYSVIYQCNSLIENIITADGVSGAAKKQLSGEARFLRAFCYFYLVNIYGDLPLLYSTDVNITATAPRNLQADVYTFIISELIAAKDLLPEAYPSADKARTNKWACAALLARSYLYTANYTKAIEESSAVINAGIYSPLETISNVFKKSSRETIFQLWTVNGFTSQGASLAPSSGTPAYFISDNLSNSFEAGDLRKVNWTGTLGAFRISTKYKKNATTTGSDAEYLVALRLTEQYLIRAEASAQNNLLAAATADLNIVRNRSGLSAVAVPATRDACVALILKERRSEFFTEWGHRYFDLKRTGQLQTVLPALKSTWTAKAFYYPIPQNEINKNPALLQNPGY